MASFRKKHQERIEVSPHQSEPSVTTAPTGAAKLPDPVADPKPPEMPEAQSPVEKAEKDAIKLQLRLKEMERAEQLNKEVAQQQPRAAEPQPQQQQPPTVEQIIANSAIPERAKAWLRQRPEYVYDPVKNNTLVALHDVAKRQSGSEFTDAYFEKMEDLLGIAPATNGQTQHRPSPAPAVLRYEAPRQQVRSAVPMSAPPTREVPSMASGRVPSRPAPLTPDEVEIALASKQTPDESDEAAIRRYEYQKQKMLRMKQSGEIQDGR